MSNVQNQDPAVDRAMDRAVDRAVDGGRHRPPLSRLVIGDATGRIAAALLVPLLLGGAAMAQVDPSYRIVAQYDTMPGAASRSMPSPAPLEILQRYADASALEKGHRSVRVLTDLGRPGRLGVLESWSSKAAWTAHKTAESTAVMTTEIRPWLVGPVEEIALTGFR